MAAPVASFPDVYRLRDQAKAELGELLDSIGGPKDLVLDADLTRPLDRIAGATFLKQHGVDKIYKMDRNQKSLSGCDQRVYLVRPRMTTMKYITDHINTERNRGDKRKYIIIMVPRRLHVCEAILESEGVMGHVTLAEFHLDLIPLDRDILSLELPEFYRSYFLDSDTTWLHTAAQSLVSIQSLAGAIPNVYTIGTGAKMAYNLMNMLSSPLGIPLTEPDFSGSEIGHLFIIDRDVDYVTTLCSQMTYEGLLDETFGIRSGLVEFPPEISGKDQSVKVMLSCKDQIYEEIRNRHFSNVFGFLSSKAKELQVGFDKRHNLASVGDMKDFVANELRDLKQNKTSLGYHIGACEMILKKKTKGDFEENLQIEHSLLEGSSTRECISFIEECIHKQYNLIQTLRLLCLLSLTCDGIPARDYKSLRTQFLQSHGFEHMSTFFNLKKLGLLMEQDLNPASKRTSFKALRKKLQLIPKTEDINLQSPTDMSFVFSGAYAPLSCKLVEQVLTREGIVGMDDITRSMAGEIYANVRVKTNKGKGGVRVSDSAASRVVLVFFLGGCTYTEITALRFLGRLKGYRFLVATTAIVTASQLVEQVKES